MKDNEKTADGGSNSQQTHTKEPESGGEVKAAALAAYPEMPEYPDMEAYTQKDGSVSDEYFEALDKWSEAAPRWAGKVEGFDAFYSRCVAAMLSDGDTENRVCSPVNIAVALAMLAELTDSGSRAQILELLGADDTRQLREKVGSLWMNNYRNDGATTSLLANSVWLDDRVAFKNDALNTLAEEYFASSYTGRMGSEALTAALRDWLDQQTGGLLKDQIQGLELTDDMILALCSTIYLKARWTNTFSESNTQEDVFHAPGGDVTAQFMHESGTNNYYYGDKFSAACKPMDSVGAMWFILPDEGTDCSSLLKDGQAMEFIVSDKDCVDSKYIIVNLSVPKFDVCGNADLAPILKELGVTDVFDSASADFSPLTDMDGVYVSQASHAARVKIDEEGCEAAAYTVMMAAGASLPPPEEVDFVLDRPFIFVITGPDSAPLFAGIVNMP